MPSPHRQAPLPARDAAGTLRTGAQLRSHVMSTTPAVSPPPAPPAQRAGGDASASPANLERLWYLAAVSGVVSVVIGVLVLVYPDPSLKLLGVFLGIDLLLVAVVLIVRGARDQMEPLVAWLLGTLALIAGLLLIRNPGRSLTVLALAFAVWLARPRGPAAWPRRP